MSKAKLFSVTVKVDSDDVSYDDIAGTDEAYNKDFKERLQHQNADVLVLQVDVSYGYRAGVNSDGSPVYRIHKTSDSLGGVTVYTGSTEERSESQKYVDAELTNMLSELAIYCRENMGLSRIQIVKLGKEAIDDLSFDGTGSKTVEAPWSE